MTIPLVVLSAACLMMLGEMRRPGRAWSQVSGWWVRALLLTGVQGVMVLLAGVVWDPWLARHRLWSAAELSVTSGAILGYLVITFVYYWWRRWRHEASFLWRWFHQVHHSPQRIEIVTSFYKHPLEIFANSVLSSVIVYLGVGLEPAAAAGAVLLSGLAELFYHWNVCAPYWPGFFFQRPESHYVHHQEGLHYGQTQSLALTPEVYSRLAGPYNRRNVYGAALAYGPLLATDPRTQPMFQSVFSRALCGDMLLLKELGINQKAVSGSMRVRLEPLPGTNLGNLPLVLEASCQ